MHGHLTLDPEHAERFYAENPGAAERALRERHQLNARSIERQRSKRRATTPRRPCIVTRRAASRPRERREARHQARSTSSGDSGSDGPCSTAAASRGVVAP
jgi:hypothetical protein